MKKYLLLSISLLGLVLNGCSSGSTLLRPPEGGASIEVTKPMWLSGIKIQKNDYTKLFPEAENNEYLQVVNAGYWLANINGEVSQLIYEFTLNNKKAFPQATVYTRSIFDNPENKGAPIIYQGTLDNVSGSTKITHATVHNVKLNAQYHMIFEVYSDSERTHLITRINQVITSPVDNSMGCVQLSKLFKEEKFGEIINSQGEIIPVDKITIACKKVAD